LFGLTYSLSQSGIHLESCDGRASARRQSLKFKSDESEMFRPSLANWIK
jgi:hypothetical protein